MNFLTSRLAAVDWLGVDLPDMEFSFVDGLEVWMAARATLVGAKHIRSAGRNASNGASGRVP